MKVTFTYDLDKDEDAYDYFAARNGFKYLTALCSIAGKYGDSNGDPKLTFRYLQKYDETLTKEQYEIVDRLCDNFYQILGELDISLDREN